MRFARRIAGASGAAVPDDELESAAMWGLLGAIDRFDPGKGAGFGTYLYHKVRGAVLDHVRVVMRRADRSRVRFHSLEHLEKMRIQNEDLKGRRGEVVRARMIDLGLSTATDSAALRLAEDPAPPLGSRREREELAALATRSLPPRLRRVVRMRFDDELSPHVIGARLGVTTRRVQQLLQGAMQVMRRALAREGLRGEDVT